MKNIITKSVLFSFLILCFLGCKKNNDTPKACTYDACSYKAPATEIKSVQDYLASKNITAATQHCSGLYYTIDNPGTGKNPTSCSDVTATYKGTLTDGSVFDQHSNANFNLSSVILGWANAVPLIKEGGKITLYIPPSLGYGSQPVRDNSGALVIPANSILIFEITLVSVN